MSLELRPFRPEHVLAVETQAIQLSDYPEGVTLEAGRALASGFAMSGFAGGRCIGCAGIAEIWQHRAIAWALLSLEAGNHMLTITRWVKEALDLHPANRIEMTVFEDFPAGRRWAEMLGFKIETPEAMRGFANGRSAFLYSRVR